MEVKITIGSEEYYVPEKITVELFEKAMVWDIADEKNIKPFVATILQCSLHDIDKLEEEVYGFISGVCIHRMSLWGEELHEQIDGHSLKPFDQLTFGEWVDIDTMMYQDTSAHIKDIGAIIYDAKVEDVLQWNIKDLGPSIKALSEWRVQVYKEHDEFFEIGDNPKGDGESQKANVALIWYDAIMTLANEEFINIERVIGRPYKEALNYLTWKKAKIAKEKMELLKRKNDLSRRTK